MSIFLKITALAGIFFLALYFSNAPLTVRRPSVFPEKTIKTASSTISATREKGIVSETQKKEEMFSEKAPEEISKEQTKNRVSPIVEKIVLPPASPSKNIVSPVPMPFPPISASTTLLVPTLVPLPSAFPLPPILPALDEEMLLRSVVKIECPTADGIGKYIGSGFVIKNNLVVTAAHVVKDSGSETCVVIFPNDRKPIHYLKGTILDFTALQKRHDEQGIDVAVLKLPSIAEYDDARAIFKMEYPFIPYPICTNPNMLGDRLLHFGYPSSFLGQNYLMESNGDAELYADIKGIKDYYSDAHGITYKTPDLSYTNDQSIMHPYMVSRVPTFYGDSGGLAFNVAKQCILGPHRGGTIGGGAGENYSLFPLLGWEGAYSILQKN